MSTTKAQAADGSVPNGLAIIFLAGGNLLLLGFHSVLGSLVTLKKGAEMQQGFTNLSCVTRRSRVSPTDQDPRFG